MKNKTCRCTFCDLQANGSVILWLLIYLMLFLFHWLFPQNFANQIFEVSKCNIIFYFIWYFGEGGCNWSLSQKNKMAISKWCTLNEIPKLERWNFNFTRWFSNRVIIKDRLDTCVQNIWQVCYQIRWHFDILIYCFWSINQFSIYIEENINWNSLIVKLRSPIYFKPSE